MQVQYYCHYDAGTVSWGRVSFPLPYFLLGSHPDLDWPKKVDFFIRIYYEFIPLVFIMYFLLATTFFTATDSFQFFPKSQEEGGVGNGAGCGVGMQGIQGR